MAKTIAEMDLDELKAERIHVMRSIEEHALSVQRDGRLTMTDDEKAKLAALNTSNLEIQARISAIEESQRLLTDALKTVETGRQVPKTDLPHPKVGDGSETRIEVMRPYRAGALRAFTGKDRDSAERAAYRAGMWLRAVIQHDNSARRYLLDNCGEDYRSFNNEGVNSAGGALVPMEFSQAIIDLREQYGVFRREARVWPMSGDTLTIPRVTGHLTVYQVGEGVAGTESNMTFNSAQLTARKWMVYTSYSTELDADAVINVADLFAQDMAWAFAKEEDRVGFAGTGSLADKGIVGLTKKIENIGSSAKGWIDATTGHDSLAEVDATDLAKVMAAVPMYALTGAKWFCSPVAKAIVFDRLKGAAGGNTVQTLEGKFQDNYMGYPIVVSDALPSAQTTINDTTLLLFGDLRMAASLGDRKGFSLARSDQYKFADDLICLKGIERVDIVINDVGDTSVAGPVAALIGCTS